MLKPLHNKYVGRYNQEETTGCGRKGTPKKFVMPEYITDGNNAYVQRFKEGWDLNIELLYDCKDSRAVFPIYNNGRLVDAIGRALYNAHPKWYSTGRGKVLCLKFLVVKVWQSLLRTLYQQQL